MPALISALPTLSPSFSSSSSSVSPRQNGIAYNVGNSHAAGTWRVFATKANTPFLTYTGAGPPFLTEWVFQVDGNLVVYNTPQGGGRTAVWASNTGPFDCSRGDTCVLDWQADGDLVVNINGAKVWRTGTAIKGNPGKVLEFDWEGHIGSYGYVRVMDASGNDIYQA